jgi:hypothetical protein
MSFDSKQFYASEFKFPIWHNGIGNSNVPQKLNDDNDDGVEAAMSRVLYFPAKN